MKFRQYLELLKDEQELIVTQEEVGWNVEAGAVGAKCLDLDGPALMFQNVKDYKGSSSLVTGIYASPTDMYPKRRRPWIRLSLAMDQARDFTYEELQAYFDDAITQRGIKPLEVSRSEWDYLMEGDKIDLTAFPFPVIHEGDGGRYSNLNIVIVEDPEVGTVSWSNERFMVVSKDAIAVKLIDDSPLTAIYNKYKKSGKPMPFAIAIGVDSTIPIAAAIYMEGITGGLPAADLAGYLGGEPIELVKARKSNLLVPANAEIVIEGVAMPDEVADEGPFYGMIRKEKQAKQPMWRVTSISYRENPIIPFDVTGIKGSDSLTIKSIAHSFKLIKILNTLWWGYRAARWVYCPVSFRMGMCIVSANPVYPGFEFLISRALFSTSHWFDKLMIVDTGCGAEELARIMGDLLQKASPVNSFHFSTGIDAFVPYNAKYPAPEGATGRMYVNATFDPTWPKELLPTRVAFETCWPKEIQEKVIANWKRWGFALEPQRRLIKF
ncbi:MAG: UbiD family decarboxylase [Bacillota bacterium]